MDKTYHIECQGIFQVVLDHADVTYISHTNFYMVIPGEEVGTILLTSTYGTVDLGWHDM